MNEIAKSDTAALIEKVVLGGDLSALTSPQRLQYYNAVCQTVGLNPLTRPFEYLLLKDEKNNDKLILYARREATDQLRQIHGCTVESVDREVMGDIVVVTVAVADPSSGRQDIAIGAVPLVSEGGTWETYQFKGQEKRRFKSDGTLTPLSPLARANAFMKAETKGKRRATLSLYGLGMLDESEVGDIVPPAEPEEPRTVSIPQAKTAPKVVTVESSKPVSVPTWEQVRDAWTPDSGIITKEQGEALFETAKAHGWTVRGLKAAIETALAVEANECPGGEPLALMMQIVAQPPAPREPGE